MPKDIEALPRTQILYKEALRAQDGYLSVLDAPGVGMEMDEAAGEALRVA